MIDGVIFWRLGILITVAVAVYTIKVLNLNDFVCCLLNLLPKKNDTFSTKKVQKSRNQLYKFIVIPCDKKL